MKLPKNFLVNMEELFKEDYNDFLNSYNSERTFGLRVNSLKISSEEFIKIFPYELEKIPWTTDGFYYKGNDDITKHPYYYAGLYYVQEPTAMAPISVLRPSEESLVLDLCSAPGGKTVQIAGFLNNTGTVVANDINFNRLKAVIRNVEKYGIKNAVIINNKEEEISDHFKDYFDCILVDAPCSGEGMFRKDDGVLKNWSLSEVDKYSKIQSEIMEVIDNSLKNSGEIVYSTCT
ncbi:MAG: RsmB/NOP family class I SAM-dependent RNA methyltransferase, partial [Clostridiales bacterium]|nr:RsmB/NOP family class I SAM-dependent RNA methyltransferase [Clostridiales bacterium]